MKILLAGGGTLGPVTPLLAIVEAWRKRDEHVSFVFAGTPNGPERSLAKAYGIAFYSITSVRFPRFFSFEWFALPVNVLVAILESWKLLWRERPHLIVGAGGYTQVPIILVGWFFRIKSFVLQTDVSPLLSNRLVVPFVEKIFVGFDETLSAFPSDKTEIIGVPVRSSLMSGSRERALQRFGLDAQRPTLLVLGGGTGSLWINEQMSQIATKLAGEMNVIHITGRGKELDALRSYGKGYTVIEQVEDGLGDIYAAADLVVSRAGMGTISELCALEKPVVIIPLPGSSQMENARVLERAQAARVLIQEETSAEKLFQIVHELMENMSARTSLANRLASLLATNVSDRIIDEMIA